MHDISRKHDISSNSLFLLVECLSVGVGLMIVLNSLTVVEEYLEGKRVLLNTIVKSPSNSLLAPALLICNPSMSKIKYTSNSGDQFDLENTTNIRSYLYKI